MHLGLVIQPNQSQKALPPREKSPQKNLEFNIIFTAPLILSECFPNERASFYPRTRMRDISECWISRSLYYVFPLCSQLRSYASKRPAHGENQFMRRKRARKCIICALEYVVFEMTIQMLNSYQAKSKFRTMTIQLRDSSNSMRKSQLNFETSSFPNNKLNNRTKTKRVSTTMIALTLKLIQGTYSNIISFISCI